MLRLGSATAAVHWQRRFASINGLPIPETDRKFRSERAEPQRTAAVAEPSRSAWSSNDSRKIRTIAAYTRAAVVFQTQPPSIVLADIKDTNAVSQGLQRTAAVAEPSRSTPPFNDSGKIRTIAAYVHSAAGLPDPAAVHCIGHNIKGTTVRMHPDIWHCSTSNPPGRPPTWPSPGCFQYSERLSVHV